MTEDGRFAPEGRRAQWLLLAGGVLGIALAMTTLLRAPAGSELPPEAVARVGDALIWADDYGRAVAALASDRRQPLDEADRRHVLDRLVDEELLVQYGEGLGLARSDRRIRADFVTAVIAAQVASVDGYEPTRAQMEEFFGDNADFFSSPGRLWVRTLWVTAAEPGAALARAEAAVALLRAGEPFEGVEGRYGSEQVAPVPNVPLPPAKLREYLGPSALLLARRMEEGEVSDPVVSDSGVRILQLVAAEPGATPELAAVADEVRSEMKRRAGDSALRQLLDRLRAEGRVQTADTAN